MEKYSAVIASTHTAEYSMHKYWARKPHNVVSYFINKIVPPNGCVLDPFCGSGVVLHEARKLGINAYGFDINPIANLITSVLIDPPKANDFKKIMDDILKSLNEEISEYYTIGEKKIKYLVHEVVVQCPLCEAIVPYTKAVIKGRSKKCPVCGQDLRFNLENLRSTNIEKLFFENEKEPVEDPEILSMQKELSEKYCMGVSESYNFSFSTNRRILAFEGMRTADLFTHRNYSILCHIADKLYDIKDSRIRNAAILLMTASVAQCSRLIPTRNNLSTGGPAWSVPGFWVPSEHLETNPIVHIEARYKKFIKALNDIDKGNYKTTARVEKMDAIAGIQKVRAEGLKADLVFFDPPYGDSVPYLEFSTMWNSFLKDVPDPEKDISVSDRKVKTEAWENYNDDLCAVLREIALTLSDNGRLLITFNNNDMKAWEALLNGLQKNNLVCEYVTYQVPAVVSSKAQFSLEGSYISDIYSVYKYDTSSAPSTDLSVITRALCMAAEARDGVIAKNLVNRVALLEWLRNNVSVDLLAEKDLIIKNLFEEKGSKYIYRQELPENRFSLKENARKATKEILSKGPCDWNELYKNVAIQYAEYGFLDPNELRTLLDGHIVMEKKRCISYID